MTARAVLWDRELAIDYITRSIVFHRKPCFDADDKTIAEEITERLEEMFTTNDEAELKDD